MSPLQTLRDHVTGSVERGESEAIKEVCTIEICPAEPRVDLAHDVSEESDLAGDLKDCTGQGDAEDSCRYVARAYDVQFVIADKDLDFERRPATEEEIRETCDAIYFDSDSDFTDSDLAEVYLIWEAANQFIQNQEYEKGII